ncbi:hypothetical protein STXM2123_2795 [Streptomyces sp. F-3]|nr:hypothetical protein STXM2123_2795 [Streptomyces sp. F-3]
MRHAGAAVPDDGERLTGRGGAGAPGGGRCRGVSPALRGSERGRH